MLIGPKPEYLLVLPPLMLALEICTSAELGLWLIRGSSLLQVNVGIPPIALWTYVVPLSQSTLGAVFFYYLSQMLQGLGISCGHCIGKVDGLSRHRVSKLRPLSVFSG